MSRKAHDSSLDIGLIFIFCRWSNRPTSCSYMKENDGMKKYSERRKKKKDEKNGKEKEWKGEEAEERGKRKIGERAKKEMTRKVPSTSQH